MHANCPTFLRQDLLNSLWNLFEPRNTFLVRPSLEGGRELTMLTCGKTIVPELPLKESSDTGYILRDTGNVVIR